MSKRRQKKRRRRRDQSLHPHGGTTRLGQRAKTPVPVSVPVSVPESPSPAELHATSLPDDMTSTAEVDTEALIDGANRLKRAAAAAAEKAARKLADKAKEAAEKAKAAAATAEASEAKLDRTIDDGWTTPTPNPDAARKAKTEIVADAATPVPALEPVAAAEPAVVERPRGSFMRGAAVGSALQVPLLSAIVWWFLPAHVKTQIGFEKVLFLVATFAGIPSTVTAGGVARFAAQQLVTRPGQKFAPLLVGAGLFAVASLGLILLAAIPLGLVPEDPIDLIPLLAAGAAAGAVTGAITGLWAGYRV